MTQSKWINGLFSSIKRVDNRMILKSYSPLSSRADQGDLFLNYVKLKGYESII